MPQKVANCCLDLFTIPQSVAILIICHKPWHLGEVMKPKEIMYVKVRLEAELHKKLKAKAELEERSMNYLINKAVELLVNQNKEVSV